MGNKIRRFGEKLARFTDEDIFEKIYNVPLFIKYIVFGILAILVVGFVYIGQMSNDPIAIESTFSKSNNDYFNFTVNSQYSVGDNVYSIITYTSNNEWYASQWDNKNHREFNKQKIENDMYLHNPIAIGQVVSYFEKEIGPIKTLEVVNKDSLSINGKLVSGDIYNTQVVGINVDGEEFELDKFYNILLKQYGQLDLLDRYNIDISKIIINNVNVNGTVEFIYANKLWVLSTMDNETEKVNIKWEDL